MTNSEIIQAYHPIYNKINEPPKVLSAESSGDKEIEHWVEVNTWECETHSVTDMRCSACGKYASLVLPHKTKCTYDYCPFCGKKIINTITKVKSKG